MDLTPMLSPVQHLGEYIREQRTAAQISLRSLAAKAGVSNPYLSQVERGLRKPSAGVLAQIAQGLQISTESLLIRAGILSPSEASPVVDAIRADRHLTDHHKSVLIEVYGAFRRESGDPGDGTNALPEEADSQDDDDRNDAGVRDEVVAQAGTAGPDEVAEQPPARAYDRAIRVEASQGSHPGRAHHSTAT